MRPCQAPQGRVRVYPRAQRQRSAWGSAWGVGCGVWGVGGDVWKRGAPVGAPLGMGGPGGVGARDYVGIAD